VLREINLYIVGLRDLYSHLLREISIAISIAGLREISVAGLREIKQCSGRSL
jgi:hypothetical protein